MSSDELVSKLNINDPIGNDAANCHTEIDPGALGLYWQRQLNRDETVYEMGPASFTSAAHLEHGQNIALHPPGNGITDVVFNPLDSNSLARYTPESSPLIRPRTRSGTASSSRLQNTLRLSVSARSHAARERRADKRSRDQARRGSSRPAGNPLSKAALEFPHILIPDAEAFANRSIEARRKEAIDAGKIKRPLNAFMLYRRSYQNVAKTRCTRNNHQQVSTVCGDSWKSHEPPEIVEKFNQLADVEKQMHERAFPDYKYDPVVSKKSGDMSLASDTSGLEYGSRRRPVKQRVSKRGPGNSYIGQPPKSNQGDYLGGGTDVDMLTSDIPPFMNAGPYWSPPSLRHITSPYELKRFVYVDNNPYREQIDASLVDQATDGGCQPISDSSDHGHGSVDSRLFFVDAFIDTTLLTAPYDSRFNGIQPNTSSEVELQDLGYQQVVANSEPTVFIPDLDNGEGHNAYLKGTDEDWEVEQLDDGSQFQDWLSQTEGFDTWT